MSRINQLLRSSLESHDSQYQVDPMASMEAYMEYRDALEEHDTTIDVQSKLGDLSENLVMVEGLVEKSRSDDTLTEDQVQLQIDAVNAVREMVEGDVAEISIESFDSLMSASLEASAKSDGLLSKMWQAILALLAKIKAAFQRMWGWITGSSKRAEDGAKEIAANAKEVAEDARDADETEPVTAEETQVTEQVEKATEVAEVVEAAVPVAQAAIKEVANLSQRTNVVIAELANASKGMDHDLPARLVEDSQAISAWAELNDALAKATVPFPKGGGRLQRSSSTGSFTATVVDSTDTLTRIWSKYPSTAKDVTKAIADIVEMEKILETGIGSTKTLLDRPDLEDRQIDRLNNLATIYRKHIADLQTAKSALTKFLQKGDQGIASARVATNNAVKATKKRRNKKKR